METIIMNAESIIIIVVIAIITAALGYFISRAKATKAIERLTVQTEQQGQQLIDLQEKLDEQIQQLNDKTTKLNNAEKAQALAEQQEQASADLSDKLQEQCNELSTQKEDLQQQLSTAKQTLSSSQASLEAEKLTSTERNEKLVHNQAQLDELQEKNNTLNSENTELRTSQQERDENHKKQLQQFEEQKEALKVEFKNLANEIFESKGKDFSEKNKESLDALLNPFKTQMKDFKDKVEDIHHKETTQQAEMKAELKQLQEMNKQVTEEAHQLATALKGKKKMQGNWGEMILENVLDRSGLVKDKDYKREVSISTEEGRQRPDAIVYLPQDKHLIIDAKVSLNAYTRYVNAEDPVERKQALKEHIDAIANHINTLSDRDYYKLPGLNSPETVFMFIPIESAFAEAFNADETLFQKAIEQKVLVATPTTLLTSLNIVRHLWRLEDQNKHTAELADKASKVYDKLRLFVDSMDNVGTALNRARDSYDKAYSQLHTGRGNLIKQASEFKKLGVSVKTEISQSLLEKAELELMPQQETTPHNVIELDNNETSILEVETE